MRRCMLAGGMLVLAMLLGGCGGSRVSTDLTEVETAFSVPWLVCRDESAAQTDGLTEAQESSQWLRRYNFAQGAVEAVAVPSGSMELIPSDAPWGMVMMEREDGEVVYGINDQGEVKNLFFTPGLHISRPLAWYGETLYYRRYPGKNSNGHLLQSYSPDTGEVYTYRVRGDGVLCVMEDGRVLALEERDAGTQVLHQYRDQSGAWQAVKRKIEAWTLGVEDLEGNWMPLMNVGEDCAVKRVWGAAPAGTDRVLLVVDDGADKRVLQWLNPVTGARQTLAGERGRSMALCVPHEVWDSGSLQLSADEKYVFYAVTELVEGDGVSKNLLAQSLQTGKCYRVYQSGKTDVEGGYVVESPTFVGGERDFVK